jgi:hypothetical protein
LNALLLAEGRAPYLSEHPGVTVEALGAVALRALHVFWSEAAPLRDDVLAHPERFALAINAMLLAAMAAANTFQGWAVRRLTGSWACAATAQLAPFLAATVFLCGIHVMAEPLLLALGLALCGGLALALADEASSAQGRLAARLGVVVGLGVATKLLFAPLGLLPLVVLRRSRDRLRCAGIALLTATLCLTPVVSRLPAMGAYYLRLATHTGPYGSGAAGVPGLGESAGVARELAASEPFTFAVTVLLALVGGSTLVSSGSGSRRRRLAVVLAALALVQLVLEAATAAQPPARPYYLTSGIALSGLGLALVLSVAASPDVGQTTRRACRAVVALLLLLGAAIQAHTALAAHEDRRRARAIVEPGGGTWAQGDPRVIHGHRVSSLPSALEFGNLYSGSFFSDDLRRLYPGVLLFDSKGIHAFGRPASLAELRAVADPDGSLRLWDSVWLPIRSLDWPTPAAIEILETRGYESLLRVRPLPLAGTPESAPAIPAIAGAVVLGGPDLWRPEQGRIPRNGLRAPTRLVFAGLAGPHWLVAEASYLRQGEQGLSVSLNGAALGHYSLPSGRWIRLTIPLAAAPGLNEIEIEYDRTRDGGPWPPHGALPSLGPGRLRRALVGVVVRRLQVVAAPPSGATSP